MRLPTHSTCFRFRRRRSPVLLLPPWMLFLAAIGCLLLAAPADERLPATAAPPHSALSDSALPDAALSDSAPCGEPQLPLRLSWQVPQEAAPPGEATLSLVLQAQAELPAVRLEILLPQGVGLLAGESSFEGTLSRGETRRVPLRLQVAGADPGRLEARAVAVTREGITFRRGAVFELGRADGGAAGLPGTVRQDPSGRKVREYPASAGPLPAPAGGAGSAGGPG